MPPSQGHVCGALRGCAVAELGVYRAVLPTRRSSADQSGDGPSTTDARSHVNHLAGVPGWVRAHRESDGPAI
jgi:hypothetical protein